MSTSEPANKKYKKVCGNFHNLTILNRSAMPGEVQLTFTYVSVGNMYLGEYVTSSALAGSMKSHSVV